MENLTGGNPPVRPLPCVVPCKLYFTISEEKYFVDNHEITFEELKKDIDSLKEGSTVKIEDENSTLKAFNAVKNYLTEKEIPFNLD